MSLLLPDQTPVLKVFLVKNRENNMTHFTGKPAQCSIGAPAQVVYTGHYGTSSGLQAHSIGADYPHIIFAKDNRTDGLRWWVLDSRNSNEYGPFAKYAGAQACVIQKQNDDDDEDCWKKEILKRLT